MSEDDLPVVDEVNSFEVERRFFVGESRVDLQTTHGQPLFVVCLYDNLFDFYAAVGEVSLYFAQIHI